MKEVYKIFTGEVYDRKDWAEEREAENVRTILDSIREVCDTQGIEGCDSCPFAIGNPRDKDNKCFFTLSPILDPQDWCIE